MSIPPHGAGTALAALLLAAGCAKGGAPAALPAAGAIELPAVAEPAPVARSAPEVSVRKEERTDAPAHGAPAPAAEAPASPPPAPSVAEIPLSVWLKRAAADPERTLQDLRALKEEGRADASLALLREGLEASLLSVLGEDAAAYAALLALERRMRPFAPVEVRGLCFTDGRDGGYGNPSRRAEAPFAPGATINVYYEVDPVCQRPDGDGFEARIDVDLAIEDGAGKRVEEFEAWEKRFRLRASTLRSRRYVTDYFFHYKGLPVPRLAKGDYRLVVRFVDLADPERRTARAEIPLPVGD